MTSEHALALKDADGVTMADALNRAGRDPEAVDRDEETLARIGTFVELHIEQGRYLADNTSPVAVASAIWSHGRWRFDGEANHADTIRLADRHDPMLKLATMIQKARSLAEEMGCVATVGKVRVLPNGVNAIPSSVTGWLDSRGADEAAVRALVPMLEAELGVGAVTESFTPDTQFNSALAADLAAVLGRGVPSSAPAPVTTQACWQPKGVRSAMLFVRNPSGVSHSPEEHAELLAVLWYM